MTHEVSDEGGSETSIGLFDRMAYVNEAYRAMFRWRSWFLGCRKTGVQALMKMRWENICYIEKCWTAIQIKVAIVSIWSFCWICILGDSACGGSVVVMVFSLQRLSQRAGEIIFVDILLTNAFGWLSERERRRQRPNVCEMEMRRKARNITAPLSVWVTFIFVCESNGYIFSNTFNAFQRMKIKIKLKDGYWSHILNISLAISIDSGSLLIHFINKFAEAPKHFRCQVVQIQFHFVRIQ